MKHRTFIVPAFLVMTLVFSCAPQQPRSQREAAWFLPALSHAPSVVRYAHAIKGEWGYIIDDDSPSYVVVAVGEDRPDHFSRGLTAKVYRDGRVYILENPGSEEIWRLDRYADR